MSRTLIAIRLLLVVIGVAKRWRGRLPGDSVGRRPGFVSRFSLTTTLMPVSPLLSWLAWLVVRRGPPTSAGSARIARQCLEHPRHANGHAFAGGRRRVC